MALCPNCFREPAAPGPCPFCGYDGIEAVKKHPQALRPGAILNGRYIVGRVLGQGGFGITYIALDDRTSERVAIKEYYPAEFAGRTADGLTVSVHSEERDDNFAFGKAQFLEEAKTLANFIGNEHIVRIHSYFEENGTAYFVMDYIEGPALDRYMAQFGGRLGVREAKHLLLPLMDALEDVHRKGIVHRDIAPDNIIITGDGMARLIDFGAARYSTGEKSKSLDVVLKHGFAPMEQYARRGRQGPWTDVYAMAATFYYAITGKVPPDAIERVQDDTLVAPSTLGIRIDDATEDALMKALEVSSADRFQSMRDFCAAMGGVPGADADEAARREKERAERERAEREKAERLAREKVEREARERAEREAAEKAAREEKARLAAEQREREKREAAERKAKEKAEREAKKTADAKPAEAGTPAASEKTKSKLPLIFGLAAVLVAALVFVFTRGGKPESPAVTAIPTASATDTAAPTAEPEAAAAAVLPEDNNVFTLKFYHIFADEASGGNESKWINKAVQEISERTGGKLVINVVPMGIMGSEAELIPQVVSGEVDMSLSSGSVWGELTDLKALGWSELPYIVTDYEELNALAERLPDMTNRQLEQEGSRLYCLGVMSMGLRCLCTANTPVYATNDCAGLKIRIPVAEIYEATAALWRADPIGMSSSKVITSLNNGTIDGFASDPWSVIARGQEESLNYFTETNHIAQLNMLMINRSSLEKLPEAYREILIEAFRDNCLDQCRDRASLYEVELEKLKAAGVEVISPTREALTEFIEATRPYFWKKVSEWNVGYLTEEFFTYLQQR